MSERSDHLIERAAALLRGAHVADKGETNAPQRPQSGVGSSGRHANPSDTLSTVPTGPLALPSRTPPARPTSSPVLSKGKSVVDLRAGMSQNPVTIASLERAGLMVARTNRTRTTEEYRIVIGRVLRALHEGHADDAGLGPEASSNVLMVTSARPGEGKSFTSLNLGGSIAQNAGESVLIVDVDAKRNSLSDLLGLADRKGFLDLVTNPDLLPDDLIVPSALPNLFFLPLGSRSAVQNGDVELDVEERRLTPPIQRLAQRFSRSLVVLDAPPCLSTSDPHTLSPAVGQVVLVVEAEKTQRNEVESAIEMIKVCPNITMLLNKVRMSPGHSFGSYDYFGSYT